MEEIQKLEKQINQLDKEIQGIKKNIDNRNRRMEDCEKEKKELQDRIKELKKSKNKNKRWRAKTGSEYFYVEDFKDVGSTSEFNYDGDKYNYKTRNYFKSEEEAEEYQEVINTYYDLMDLAEELNNGEKINWNDETQCKYVIYYNYKENSLEKTYDYWCKDLGQIYCLDGGFLEKAIEKIGKDKLTKLFTYERN